LKCLLQPLRHPLLQQVFGAGLQHLGAGLLHLRGAGLQHFRAGAHFFGAGLQHLGAGLQHFTVFVQELLKRLKIPASALEALIQTSANPAVRDIHFIVTSPLIEFETNVKNSWCETCGQQRPANRSGVQHNKTK